MMITKTSPDGVKKIRAREGCVLHTYRDTKGIPTCCVGHTGRTSPPVPKMGEAWTMDQADAFLATDLAPVEATIRKAVNVPISQHQFDALSSFGFNIGEGGLAGSTVVRKLNLGDIKGAADAFMLWCKPSELTGRRRDERAQFLTPDPAVDKQLVKELAVAATETKTAAKDQGATAGALATAAVVVGPIVATTGHPAVGIGAGIAMALGALATSIMAMFSHTKASTLANNAGAASDRASS